MYQVSLAVRAGLLLILIGFTRSILGVGSILPATLLLHTVPPQTFEPCLLCVGLAPKGMMLCNVSISPLAYIALDGVWCFVPHLAGWDTTELKA